MNKRTVILKGDPVYNENGVATATVKPGYLVKGVSFIAPQTATVVPMPKAFAVEREEFGTGIDNARQGSGTISAFYASGDVVKVAVCGPGDVVTAYLASGESVSEDAVLASDGAGLLNAISVYSSGVGDDYPIARALETIAAPSGAVLIKVEIL